MGNTYFRISAISFCKDHPHLRGEYQRPSPLPSWCRGSPPLAWGIPTNTNWVTVLLGITPTCVGNTTTQSLDLATIRDHPHLRGEYEREATWRSPQGGSPPLAWGIQRPETALSCDVRITPTCVGNTGQAPHRERHKRDHPHLRGEYTLSKHTCWTPRGSPPLAWGILQKTLAINPKHGITPTCVGNTLNFQGKTGRH